MCGTIPPFFHTTSWRYKLEQKQFILVLTVKNVLVILNQCCGFSDRRSEMLTAECFHISACLLSEFI
jgi:hypothetical protein